MRIAVSGTHFMGKSTLIEDFTKVHPEYRTEIEPYYQLQDEKAMELSLEPSLDSLVEQLDLSIEQLNRSLAEQNIMFDRCPIDFIAYAMIIADENQFDINDCEIADRFPDVQEALSHLDLIAFIPISKQQPIEYTEENPLYRKAADKNFKKIYRDDLYELFPRYNHPRIIEITGERAMRVQILKSYL